MKLRHLSPFTRRAIEFTHGCVDGSSEHLPTWDGKILHVHRIATEENVLHEVAHWIVASPEDRLRPNYGCGTDPDGGPIVMSKWLTSPRCLAELLRGQDDEETKRAVRDTVRCLELVERRNDHEESLAAFVTIVLMRQAGLRWAPRMRKIFNTEERREAFWITMIELDGRGVDLENPLRAFAREDV